MFLKLAYFVLNPDRLSTVSLSFSSISNTGNIFSIFVTADELSAKNRS